MLNDGDVISMKTENRYFNLINISAIIILIIAASLYGPSLFSVLCATGGSVIALKSSKFRIGKRLLFFLFLLLIFFTAATQFSVISDMAGPKGLRKEIRGTETIIVPGAGINYDQPSRYLKARLDGASDILKKYPGTNVIVTGGKAPEEVYSESEVMKNYLVSEGIDPKRIFMEDTSVNTMENFMFSKKIIEKENLDVNIITVTNSFHNLRCSMIAKYLNMNSTPAPVITPILPLRIFYTLKETASFIKLLIVTRFGLI